MFAALTLEHEPLTLSWGTFLGSLNAWTQVVGGFAMLGLVVWLIFYVVSRGSPETVNVLARAGVGTLVVLLCVLFGPFGALAVFLLAVRRKGSFADIRLGTAGQERGALTTVLFIGAFVWAAFGYLLLLALYLPELRQSGDPAGAAERAAAAPVGWRPLLQSVLWTLSGASAIFAVVLPILADFTRLSPRRIWAIARLSFKEAVRRKVLWVFLALLLVVLFGSWFIQNKPEDQVRTYVQVVSLAMALLMLILAALIASFGIPDDIRHQTIHTVLTKPVQRFEIFLGRFLGYGALMTAALVVISALGLLYVLRNINPEAQEESLKAREPLYGTLTFQGTKDKEKGESVGREWDYRTYISGKGRNSTDPVQYAVWGFPEVPATLRDRGKVRLEFALDIYRTHKGEREGEGVLGTILVESWRFDADRPEMMKLYESRRDELRAQGVPDVEARLADELGFYQIGPMEIKDYHTQAIDVEAGVFKNAATPAGPEDRERQDDLRRRREWPPAPVRVRVRCDSGAQFLGMAKYDLYFRLDTEGSAATNKARFAVNFFKGGFGLWLRLCLMIGLAVAVSTYLSGVITLLTTWILYGLGFFRDFIQEVALHRNPGGGPVESSMRLLKRPGGEPIAGQLDDSATTQVATSLDEVFSFGLRRILNLIPDVSHFIFTDYVSEGVAIPAGNMAMSFLVLLGYLLPWAVLAYYLLKWREVASST